MNELMKSSAASCRPSPVKCHQLSSPSRIIFRRPRSGAPTSRRSSQARRRSSAGAAAPRPPWPIAGCRP
uniref:Uncharacterized protein n=1 Tax=Triticum urartu TaxID=4572 RepID=A0A8R7TWI8_TRIUA